MKKTIERIEDNVAAKYSKTYANPTNFKKAIEAAEKKLGTKINAIPVALENGRIGVYVHVRNPDGHEFMKVLHGTSGWMVAN